MSVIGNASPQVLKNKGIPVKIHKVVKDEGGVWQRITDPDTGEAVLLDVWMQITNDVLADIEERWGSLEQWQEILSKKPFSVVGATMALILGYQGADGLDYRRAGRAMVDGGISDYANAIGVAVQLANGADAVGAGEDLAAGKKAAEKARQDQAVAVAKARVEREESEVRVVQGEVVESDTPTLPLSVEAGISTQPGTPSTPGTTGSNSGASSDELSTSSGV